MPKEHPLDCLCGSCAVKHDVDVLTDDESCPYSINCHTHQLWEKYNHLDIQVCLALSPEILKKIIAMAAEKVAGGVRFMPQHQYTGILPNLPVLFEFSYDGGRLVLRMILPDERGAFKGAFKGQYSGTFTLHPAHRRLMRALYAGEQPMSELCGRADWSYEISQLMLAGLVDAVNANDMIALTKHGRRLFEHLNPPAKK